MYCNDGGRTIPQDRHRPWGDSVRITPASSVREGKRDEGKRDCPLFKKGQSLFPSLTGPAGALGLVGISTTAYNDNV